MNPLLKHPTLVVTDLSVLRGRPEQFLSPEDGIVINDIVLVEIATGHRHDEEPFQFGKWLRDHSDRLYVGNYWWDVASYESSINRMASNNEAILWPLTRVLREYVAQNDPDKWRGVFAQARHARRA